MYGLLLRELEAMAQVYHMSHSSWSIEMRLLFRTRARYLYVVHSSGCTDSYDAVSYVWIPAYSVHQA